MRDGDWAKVGMRADAAIQFSRRGRLPGTSWFDIVFEVEEISTVAEMRVGSKESVCMRV
jgi:hypothetical protein